MKAGFFVKLAVVAGMAAGSLFGHGVASAACCELENVQNTGYQIGAVEGGSAARLRTPPLWNAPYSTGHTGYSPGLVGGVSVAAADLD